MAQLICIAHGGLRQVFVSMPAGMMWVTFRWRSWMSRSVLWKEKWVQWLAGRDVAARNVGAR